VNKQRSRTPREWMEYPKTMVDTKCGTVEVTVTSATTAYVDASSNGKFLTHRGKRYVFSIHLQKKQEGWVLAENTLAYTHIFGSYFGPTPPSYKKAMEQEIEKRVSDLLESDPMIGALAERVRVNNDLTRAEGKVVEAETALEEAVKTVNGLLAELERLP